MESDGERMLSSMEEKKPQRKKQMKTPMQKEMLEEAYQAEKYPSEAAKAELARQLDITEKQLNMWFNHRRRKDRVLEVEEAASLERRGGAPQDDHHDPGVASVSGGGGDLGISSGRHSGDVQYISGKPSHYYAGAGQGFYNDELNTRPGMGKPAGRGRGHRRGPGAVDEHKRKRRGPEAALLMAQAAAIDEVKENFPAFQVEGPPLVVEFDELPPGAFQEGRKHKGLDAGGTGDEAWLAMRHSERKLSRGQSDEEPSGRDSEAMPLSKGLPRSQAAMPKSWLPPRNGSQSDFFSPKSGHTPQSDTYSPRPATGPGGMYSHADAERYNLDRDIDHDQQYWMGARQGKGELHPSDARLSDGYHQSGGSRHITDSMQQHGPRFRPSGSGSAALDRPAELSLHDQHGFVPSVGRSGHALELSGGRPVYGRPVMGGTDLSMPMPRLHVGRGGGGGGGRGRGRGGWGLGRDDLDSVETRHLEALAKARAEGDVVEIQAHQEALDEIQAKRRAIAEEKLRHLEELERAKLEKKRKSEEQRLAKELEVREKRLKKEMDKAELARRKMEEQARRDHDRQERDRRKEEERLVREKMKEEERVIRERRRETERCEREKQKQEMRAEKEMKKEAVRREREAAKERAAKERALAKKLAKEAAELMDDEELELLEAKRAAGLELLKNEAEGDDAMPGAFLGLELQVSTMTRKQFPPEDVMLKMKPPLGVAPWPDVESAQGDVLVVWNFAQAFGELLGIPVFTLSELVQALHDRESFLLNELHLALLRVVLHDLDVSSESSLPTVGGEGLDVPLAAEHPVRMAASVWGFDVGQWLRHLNVLTWPEILRQFGLAAGLGPKLKSGNRLDEPEETVGHTDAVALLRSGAAVAAAVRTAVGRKQRLAKAHQGSRRQSKLTPGTIKYAAFMVLCTAGEEGLTVPEISDRIQKAGLRDFRTSRSPEATIVGVLSRDGYFLKLGVSRYCVRSPHRKDPSEAERILAAAREAVAGVAPKDDVEEEEKMEGEVKEEEEEEEEEEEGDDLGMEVEVPEAAIGGEAHSQLKADCKGPVKSGSRPPEGGQKGLEGVAVDAEVGAAVVEVDDADCMTEDNEWEGEGARSWLRGLTDWEYVDLAVEHRLAALVDLTHFANESRSVRAELERRYEAACAMRRQMWADAQADRRRHREEAILRAQSMAAGKNPNQSPLPATPAEPGRFSPSATPPHTQFPAIKSDDSGDKGQQPDSSFAVSFLSPSGQKVEEGKPELVTDGMGRPVVSSKGEVAATDEAAAVHQAERLKARRDNIGHMADEVYAIRVGWLGRDRRYNRYWRFSGADSQAKGVVGGQIFFESAEDGHWEVVDSEEGLAALMGALDVRGRREAALHASLKRHAPSLRLAMRALCSQQLQAAELSGAAVKMQSEVASAIHIETGVASAGEHKRAYKKLTEVKSALWSRVETKAGAALRQIGGHDGRARCNGCQELIRRKEACHCPHCHITLSRNTVTHAQYLAHMELCEAELRSGKVVPSDGPPSELPPRLQRVKADLLDIEDALPREALGGWAETYRVIWLQKVKCSCTARELLLALAELEGAVKRDWISLSFDTTREILERSSSGSHSARSPLLLPWIPHTSTAVALRLLAFGEALAYREEDKPKNHVTKAIEADLATDVMGRERPSVYHSSDEDEGVNADDATELGKPRQKVGKFASLSARDGVRTLGGGRGSRGRGGASRGRPSVDVGLPRLPPALPSEDFQLPAREFSASKLSSGRGRGRSKTVGGVKRRLKKVGGPLAVETSRDYETHLKGPRKLKLKESVVMGSGFGSQGLDEGNLEFRRGFKAPQAKMVVSEAEEVEEEEEVEATREEVDDDAGGEEEDAGGEESEDDAGGKRDEFAEHSSSGPNSDSGDQARGVSDDDGGYDDDDLIGSPSVELESDDDEDVEVDYYDRSHGRGLPDKREGDDSAEGGDTDED